MATQNILDDVWESDTETESDLLSYDLKKLREHHNKRGYLDGVTRSKETNLQGGFDEGFPTGAQLGLQVGKLIGILQGLVFKYGDQDRALVDDLTAAKKELRINKVLTKALFDANLDLEDKHPLVEKWKCNVKMHCNKYSVQTSL